MERHPSTQSTRHDGNQCTARRSVSIFSRRGTATPKSKTSSLLETMVDSNRAPMHAQTPSTSRRSSWMKKSKPSAKSQEGTVLHAVPPHTAGHSMSPLEIAMATSPNEEILLAIGKSSTTDTLPTTSPLNNGREGSINQRQSSFNSRIGVWRDGVAFWDVEKRPTGKPAASDVLETAAEPCLLIPEKLQRPRLSVVIPGNKLRQILGEGVPIPQEAYKPINVAPATVTSRHSLSPQAMSLDQKSIHPAFRTTSVSMEKHHEAGSLSSRGNSRSSVSSNTIFQDDTFDNGSSYSRHSSMTSVELDEVVHNPHWNPLDVPKRSVSAAFSITSPVQAGIFDDASAEGHTPRAGPSTDFHTPKNAQVQQLTGTSSQGADENRAFPSDEHPFPSPTLSEAVYDLQTQLSAITEERSTTTIDFEACTEVSDYESVSVSRAPTLPKRSRKREWVRPASSTRTVQLPLPSSDMPVRRQSVPYRQQQRMTDNENGVKRSSSMHHPVLNSTKSTGTILSTLVESKSPSDMSNKESQISLLEHGPIGLKVMAFVSDFADLQALSTVNRDMLKLYQQNEMRLLKSVLFNLSPPAWELREWSPFPFESVVPTDYPEDAELTPLTYKSCVRHDQAVVQELKTVIVTKCQSFLRPETISSLMTDDSTRFEAAIYRIWTFCRIFGCDRGRESDLKGQLDWLKGGPLAHQKGCAATLSFNPEFDMDGILLNPPDHFAAGNASGMSAEQLYDMTEIWDCLCTLMQPYGENLGKAREVGLFENTQISSSGFQSDGAMLQEWIFYALTLGPSVVLELARFQDACDAGFDFASMNGWTDWTAPHSGMSRRGFFREPVSQLYEEQLMASAAGGQAKDVSKTLLRKRQTVEVSLACRQKPTVSTKAHDKGCSLSRRDSALAPEVHNRPNPRRYSTPTPISPPSAVTGGWRVHPASWSPRRVSPIIEDRVETFNRLSLLTLEGMADDTAGLAISKICDMGFSPTQAKEALRVTDMGNGLRVDRAVDWLLRQNQF